MVKDDDFRVPVRYRLPGEPINSTAIISNIEFEFTERVYKLHFFEIFDIIAELGGIRACLLPLLMSFSPFYAMNFFHQLARIIQGKMSDKQFQEMIKVITIVNKQFILINEASQNNQIKVNRKNRKEVV